MNLNPLELKKEFPAIGQQFDKHDLLYLDSASSSLKPQVVIDRLHQFYKYETANVHRGIHRLSNNATLAYEEARKKIAQFLSAKSSDEIVFTRGTTEAINLVAAGLQNDPIKNSQGHSSQGDKGDGVILLSQMEHHSNIVPWQRLNKEVQFVKVTNNGELNFDDYKRRLQENNVHLVALTSCSNVLGTINPVKKYTNLAKKYGALTLIDAAQSVNAYPVNVQEWGLRLLMFLWS